MVSRQDGAALAAAATAANLTVPPVMVNRLWENFHKVLSRRKPLTGNKLRKIAYDRIGALPMTHRTYGPFMQIDGANPWDGWDTDAHGGAP